MKKERRSQVLTGNNYWLHATMALLCLYISVHMILRASRYAHFWFWRNNWLLILTLQGQSSLIKGSPNRDPDCLSTFHFSGFPLHTRGPCWSHLALQSVGLSDSPYPQDSSVCIHTDVANILVGVPPKAGEWGKHKRSTGTCNHGLIQYPLRIE